MANYVFKGPGPVHDPVLGLVRPDDVRDFAEEPDWGPWQLLAEAFTEASATAPGQAAGEPAEVPPSASPLAVTPPELAAQGILARDLKGM